MIGLLKRTSRHCQSGSIMPALVSLMVALSIFAVALMTVIVDNIYTVSYNINQQKALNIAESGINYYLWHMAHNGQDYRDGQSTPADPDPNLGYGPYKHNYVGSDGKKQGTFTLWVKPESKGSTVVTVRSIGQVGSDSQNRRVIEAKLGAASFASYGLVADTEFWFGRNETANGPVFSNQGVHMDGKNTDTVGSANARYRPDSRYGGDGRMHNGVWCDSSVTSPVDCDSRDKSSWHYPMPSVDFNNVASSLCNIKKVAFREDQSTAGIADQSNACQQTPSTRTAGYLPRLSRWWQATRGYLIELNPDGSYNLSKVTGEYDRAGSYSSALSTRTIGSNIAIPASGVIYAEDNVWVRTNPDFHGRATIAAGRLGSNYYKADINIADDVRYSTKDGQDAIGLVAEGNVIIKPYAPPNSSSFNFEVDAATLAQNGSVTWPEEYRSNPWLCTRGWVNPSQTFTFYGSVATRQDWTWNYQSGWCGDAKYDPSSGYYISGIEHTNTQYDYNLLYAPPPSYPVTGHYQVLSWREVLPTP